MYGQPPYRGFESHPLRHIKVFRHSGDETETQELVNCKRIANLYLTKASCHRKRSRPAFGRLLFLCKQHPTPTVEDYGPRSESDKEAVCYNRTCTEDYLEGGVGRIPVTKRSKLDCRGKGNSDESGHGSKFRSKMDRHNAAGRWSRRSALFRLAVFFSDG